MESGVLRFKNSTISQAVCAGVLLENVKVKLSSQVCESDRFWRFLCGFNNET